MYQPKFNSVLVEIEQDKWGNGNDDSMLGKSFSRGTVISGAEYLPTMQHPIPLEDVQHVYYKNMDSMIGKKIIWNEGAESGTTFEDDGKVYGFIYWSDIRGVKE